MIVLGKLLAIFEEQGHSSHTMECMVLKRLIVY